MRGMNVNVALEARKLREPLASSDSACRASLNYVSHLLTVRSSAKAKACQCGYCQVIICESSIIAAA